MTVYWKGKSGSKYPYASAELPARPPSNKEGNYVFAWKGAQYWHAVYVGQGKLQDRYDAAIEEGCVTEKGATHYHWRPNDSKSSRTDEESDIIEGNPECKAPNGCNGQGP